MVAVGMAEVFGCVREASSRQQQLPLELRHQPATHSTNSHHLFSFTLCASLHHPLPSLSRQLFGKETKASQLHHDGKYKFVLYLTLSANPP